MELTLKILCSVICESIMLWIFTLFIKAERSNIIELGYRSESMRFKITKKSMPLLDRFLHWSLCKGAKRNKACVWLYFSFNLLIVISTVCSIILAILLLFSAEIREILLYQLTYMYTVIFIRCGVHLFIDLLFLPSEQKRYGIRKK